MQYKLYMVILEYNVNKELGMLKKILYSIYVVIMPAFFVFVIFGIIQNQIRMEAEITFRIEWVMIWHILSNLLFGVAFAHIILLKPQNIKKRHDAILFFATAFYLLFFILDPFIFFLLPWSEATGYMLILFALYMFKAIKICITKNNTGASIQL